MLEKIYRLYKNQDLSDSELAELICCEDAEANAYLRDCADKIRRENYGNKIWLRGLIEISSYCKNDCLYCGIRRSNRNANRYRLTPDEIFNACENGYNLGFRTFVLQGGEDAYFTDDVLCPLIERIKKSYPDCAVTLSLGERSEESYRRLKASGADRYLLRHETASEEHYSKLHPSEMSLENRKKCLFTLKSLGYQIGAGFMVQSPFQTTENLVDDLRFLQELNPHMIGIGPFIPHHDTPFAEEKSGTLELTLRLLSILRLMFPKALIPATTALGTIADNGRELGIMHGCNVVMPNLSPVSVRKKYELYDNKICTGEESAECRKCLERRIQSVGFEVEESRGDSKIDTCQ